MDNMRFPPQLEAMGVSDQIGSGVVRSRFQGGFKGRVPKAKGALPKVWKGKPKINYKLLGVPLKKKTKDLDSSNESNSQEMFVLDNDYKREPSEQEIPIWLNP